MDVAIADGPSALRGLVAAALTPVTRRQRRPSQIGVCLPAHKTFYAAKNLRLVKTGSGSFIRGNKRYRCGGGAVLTTVYGVESGSTFWRKNKVRQNAK